jgi:hypothetical protein
MLMNAEVYDALLEARATPDEARAAAISVATSDDRLARIEWRLDVLTIITSLTVTGTAAVLAKLFGSA